MTKYETFTPVDHLTVRHACREALSQHGIRTNPGFTDKNILDGISACLGVHKDHSGIDESTEASALYFRDALGRLLGLEIPPTTEDLVDAIKRIQ